MTAPRIGVLDQSPIPDGSTAAQALANTIDLAQQCERLGYHRYWVAEHHNSTGLAGASPEILIGQIAAATSTMRVGSGGVMLSHYAPYKVAESFLTLATMFPERIDLGIGRAPGSDQVTMYALAAADQPRPVAHYPSMVRELLGFLHDDLPPESPFAGRVRAVPATDATPPPVWMLASSADSASFAAHFGLPLGWAHFFGTMDGPPVADAYRDAFQPSVWFPEPVVSVAASVICAESDDEAELLASSVRAWRRKGLSGPIPPPDVDANQPNPLHIEQGPRPMIVGSPERCAAELLALGEDYGADELLAVTIVWDHRARVRSYELLSDALGLART